MSQQEEVTATQQDPACTVGLTAATRSSSMPLLPPSSASRMAFITHYFPYSSSYVESLNVTCRKIVSEVV